MTTSETNTDIYFLLGIIALFFLALIIIAIASFINDFSRELKFLNVEIDRNVGEERKYWIKERRRLWLSLLPFFKY